MIQFSFDKLRQLGMSPAMAQTLACLDEPPGGPYQCMRVSSVHRETLELHDGLHLIPARSLAALERELQAQGTALTVGDWVLCRCDEHAQHWVATRVPPLTHIVRRDADGTRHAVVSNVDTALLVMGLDLDFNLQRLERYLALAAGSGVLAVVVLTKADLMTDQSAKLQEQIMAVRQRIGQGIEVLALDARSPGATALLKAYLAPGQTLVLLGSSGAGKSTLTNSLLGANTQDTGAVREHDSRGKHTTTARSLHCLPGGACVIDTPGVRTLRPDVDAQTLGQLFDDVTQLSAQCRFRDCRHADEPGCAVRSQVAPERLRNYHKLLRESRRDEMSALERQRRLSEWKARGRAGRQRLEMKRGHP